MTPGVVVVVGDDSAAGRPDRRIPIVEEMMKGLLVVGLAKVDEGLDWVLYRPAVVKATMWLPRWWLCDPARLSIWLDDRRGIGYWARSIVPGGLWSAGSHPPLRRSGR